MKLSLQAATPTKQTAVPGAAGTPAAPAAEILEAKKSSTGSGGRKTTNWILAEVLLLFKAWLYVSDNSAGTDNGSDVFWNLIKKRFELTGGEDGVSVADRTIGALKSKFNKVSSEVQKYLEAYFSVKLIYQTITGGKTKPELADAVDSLWRQNTGSAADAEFEYKAVAGLVRDEPKWQEHAKTLNPSSNSKKASASPAHAASSSSDQKKSAAKGQKKPRAKRNYTGNITDEPVEVDEGSSVAVLVKEEPVSEGDGDESKRQRGDGAKKAKRLEALTQSQEKESAKRVQVDSKEHKELMEVTQSLSTAITTFVAAKTAPKPSEPTMDWATKIQIIDKDTSSMPPGPTKDFYVAMQAKLAKEAAAEQ